MTKPNKTTNYIGLLVPLIIAPVVLSTIFTENPEIKTEVWRILTTIWLGIGILLLAAIPIVAITAYLPIRLFVYLMDLQKPPKKRHKRFWI